MKAWAKVGVCRGRLEEVSGGNKGTYVILWILKIFLKGGNNKAFKKLITSDSVEGLGEKFEFLTWTVKSLLVLFTDLVSTKGRAG